MNTRSIVDRNDDVLLSAPSLSKERDVIDTPRLSMLGDSSPLTIPTKDIPTKDIPTKNGTEKTGDETKKRRKKRKKKWTKPEGKPKRPLSAYNLFFARERILMLGKDVPTAEQEALKKKVHCKTHGKISFAVMARTIGAKWKTLGADERKIYEDKAREEKARYLKELASWKEAQKNGAAADSRLELGKMIDGNMGKSGIVGMNAQAPSMSEMNMPSSTLEGMNSFSQGNSGQNSSLMRLLLEEENRSRYLSLLRLQNQANQNRLSPIDQTAFPLSGISRRVSTPMDSMAGSQQVPNFNTDTLFADNRALMRNMQGPQNPQLEYNNGYQQVLQGYATMRQLEEQQLRMVGSFNGRNNGM